MQILLKLFVSFALIGLGAYGGGLVTIPLIQHELVDQRHWLTFDEMARILAISQMTPGPIAINAATLVGFQIAGFWGAVAATVAVVLPSLSILLCLAPFMDRIGQNAKVLRFKAGMQLGILSLILFAAWSYGTAAIKNGQELLLAVAAFLFLIVSEGKVHPIWAILACGAVGSIIF
ncbi:MAG TPA: chromate transporter [Verrucomicrobia bacterium]|nr:MAG: hypothetical protein A2X46_18240 [Lentisphaerae bacterium GWF2_57_35]HBA85325.1 chromate transporter [Verrucomicrobiota bacterium]